jgi:hypothetical protein
VGTGLRESELITKLRAIKAKRLLLIVNACHAGELSPVLAPSEEPLTGTPLPLQITAALLGTGEGRVIISACRESQYSFIGPGPLTLFTQALVDGLQGKGVGSNRGYISVFDLYTHLYFAVDETLPRKVSAAVRQRYGEKQEPELTILKGVGPFAVALYRGATTFGEFDAAGTPPEGMAVRPVNPAFSQAMLRQHQQTISGNAQVGVAIAGDVHGPITDQTGGANFGTGNTIGSIGDVVAGDKIGDDKVGGDKITTGDIHGTGIAIGRGARAINAGFYQPDMTVFGGVHQAQRDLYVEAGAHGKGTETIAALFINVLEKAAKYPESEVPILRSCIEMLYDAVSQIVDNSRPGEAPASFERHVQVLRLLAPSLAETLLTDLANQEVAPHVQAVARSMQGQKA